MTKLTPWQITEEFELFPDNYTFPAACGSGVLFYGLDSTGFQSINYELASRYIPSAGLTADDLYVFHKQMHSTHLFYDDIGKIPVQQMPLGYLSFSILFDGYRLAPSLLINLASNWSRVTDLKTGKLSTTYNIENRGIQLKIDHVILPGTVNPHFMIKAGSIDGKEHTVDIRFELKLRTRHGEPLWDIAPSELAADESGIYAASAKTLKNGKYETVDDYMVGWGLWMKDAKYSAITELKEFCPKDVETYKPPIPDSNELSNARRITLCAIKRLLVKKDEAGQTELCLHFGSGITNSADLKSIRGSLTEHSRMGFDSALKKSQEFWDLFYDRVARISTGNDKVDFLYNSTMQLFITSMAFDSGLPANFCNTAGSLWWNNSTFHDSMYSARGLIQANAIEEMKIFIDWLRDYEWQKEDRPIYWITRFDGYPITKHMVDQEDTGFIALSSLTMITIMFTEATEYSFLKNKKLYDMLKQSVQYVSKYLLEKKENTYYLKTPVIEDVIPSAYESTQEARFLLSLRPIFRKAYEYAVLLSRDKEDRDEWFEISQNLYIPIDEEGFILQYENGERLVSMFMHYEMFNPHPDDFKPVEAQIELWKSEGIGKWPWTLSCISSMGCKWKDGRFAIEKFNTAVNDDTYGRGYFSEIYLKDHHEDMMYYLNSLPPFATGHGSYLFALIEHYVRSSIWKGIIEIGPLQGTEFYEKAWSIERVRSLNGVLVSASGNTLKIRGEITGREDRDDMIELIRPRELQKKACRLKYGSVEQEFSADEPVRFIVKAKTVTGFSLE